MTSVIDFEKKEFIKNVWNKKAQVYNRPIAWDFKLDIDNISSLALESEVTSRIIKFKNNDLKSFDYEEGPFSLEELANLPPETPWSLMIQELEEYIPELESIKDFFSFINPVLREDIMGVICGPKGTTGPHVDRYGVFIIPVVGEKTWRLEKNLISEEVAEERQVQSDDLKILENFETDREFKLDEKMMLYIPPGLAHHATSKDLSLSLSYGVKAPRVQIILDVLYTKMINEIHSDRRLGINLNSESNKISLESLSDQQDVLLSLLKFHNIQDLAEVLAEARQWEGY